MFFCSARFRKTFLFYTSYKMVAQSLANFPTLAKQRGRDFVLRGRENTAWKRKQLGGGKIESQV